MKKALTGNQLKIIALIAMTIDHIGKFMFPDIALFSVIGRLAYPIFGYFIAEGYFYTRNKIRYFAMIFGVGAICQLVYFFAEQSLYQCIMITFSLSILLMCAFDNMQKKRSLISTFFAVFATVLVYFISEILPGIINSTDFRIDYGFWGIVFPALIYLANGRVFKLGITVAGLMPLAMSIGGIQWFSYLAIPLIAMYNGKRGKFCMKYLFYIYYPLHLAVIYFIGMRWIYR